MNKQTEKSPKSIQEILEMLKTNPQDQNAHLLLGRQCLKVAERMSRSREYYKSAIDADIVVSDACQKMLRQVSNGTEFKTEGSFCNYLSRILKNSFYDALRKAKAQYNTPNFAQVSIDAMINTHIADYASIVYDHQGDLCSKFSIADKSLSAVSIKNREALFHTREALAEMFSRLKLLKRHLKVKAFHIFIKRTFSDMSSKEVAQKYGVSANTVDQICSRARQFIKNPEASHKYAA